MALSKPAHQSLFDPRRDLRALPRTRLDVQGTIFVIEDQSEQKCVVLDLSPDGAGLKSTCTAALGTNIVLHVQNLGRYEGTLVRHDRMYVGVKFKYSNAKRARITEAIAAFIEGASLPSTPMRQSARVGELNLPYKFALESGETSECEIVDIALTGVAFRAVVRPPIGERLVFGKSAAEVTRHTKDGFAVAFCFPVDANEP